jgi:hypothetical protein
MTQNAFRLSKRAWESSKRLMEQELAIGNGKRLPHSGSENGDASK